MKIVITGHTRGLGKAFYEHFIKDPTNTVIGLSRSQGTDVSSSLDKVLEISKNCDLFINNAYSGLAQNKLVKLLNGHVSMLVVSGSQGGYFSNLIPTDYGQHKKNLAELCHMISLDKNSTTKILHLDLSCLEGNEVDINDPDNLKCDSITALKDIVDTVAFWIKNPSFNDVRFNFKITNLLYDQISTKMHTGKELDLLLEKIKQAVDKSA
jgi:hypothetical protein